MLAGYSPADEQKENKRTHARHQNGDIGIEAHQQGGQYGRTEHRHDVLSAHGDVLRPGHVFVGLHNGAVGATLDFAPAREISVRPGMRALFFYDLICCFTEARSEEQTSELQSLMRISYAVFCLTIKTKTEHTHQ